MILSPRTFGVQRIDPGQWTSFAAQGWRRCETPQEIVLVKISPARERSLDDDRWLNSRAPKVRRWLHRGWQGSTLGCSSRHADGEAYEGSRSSDRGTSARAIRGNCNIVSTRQKTSGPLSPRQRAETFRRCERTSRSRPNIQHELPRAVEDANVIIVRRIVCGRYVVGYFRSGNVVRQEESPKLGNILRRTLKSSGSLAARYEELQRRGAPARRRNCDRSWAVRNTDVLARSECAEHRSLARRPDQDLPVGRGRCRNQIRGIREVGDSIRRAR